jgi:hypothetical protein
MTLCPRIPFYIYRSGSQKKSKSLDPNTQSTCGRGGQGGQGGREGQGGLGGQCGPGGKGGLGGQAA